MVRTSDLKKLVHESARSLAKMLAAEDQPEKGSSTTARQEKIENEILQHSQDLETKMFEGLKACLLSLDHCLTLPLSKEKVTEELHIAIRSINTKDAFVKLEQGFSQERTWKESLGISDICMQSLYEGARSLFERKEFEPACQAFFVICAIDPSQSAYWIGLGHSSFQLQNYEQALVAYAMAGGIDPENAWPHIWAANCFEEENDFPQAKMALNEAISIEQAKTPKNLELIHALEKRIQTK